LPSLGPFSKAPRGIWAALEAAGKVIGPYDLLIAATGVHYGHPMATLNISEFRQVPGPHLINVDPFLCPETT